MKTQVAITGGGPSGPLLSLLLYSRGIESVVLERKTKQCMRARTRAEVLEEGLVRLLEEAGCVDCLPAEGYAHDGTLMSHACVWKAERLSWLFASVTLRHPGQSEFDIKMQVTDLEFLRSNMAAQRAREHNHVGLPC